MSLSHQTLSALHELMAQDKELVAQVQASDDAAQAAALIAEAASKNGLAVNPAELTAHFEEASQTSADQALSDQQLEAVAGGMEADIGKRGLISIFTMGIGCVVIGIGQAAGDMMGFTKKFG